MIQVKKYGSKNAIMISNEAEMVDVFISYREPMLLVDWNNKTIKVNKNKFSVTTSRHLNMFKRDADFDYKESKGWAIEQVESIDGMTYSMNKAAQ